MVFNSTRRKQVRKFSFKSNKRRYNTVKPHAKSSESNDPNTYNSDNAIVNSNLPHIKVNNER